MQVEPPFNPVQLLASGLWQGVGTLADWFWNLSFELQLLLLALVVVRAMWPELFNDAAPARRRSRWRRRSWED